MLPPPPSLETITGRQQKEEQKSPLSENLAPSSDPVGQETPILGERTPSPEPMEWVEEQPREIKNEQKEKPTYGEKKQNKGTDQGTQEVTEVETTGNSDETPENGMDQGKTEKDNREGNPDKSEGNLDAPITARQMMPIMQFLNEVKLHMDAMSERQGEQEKVARKQEMKQEELSGSRKRRHTPYNPAERERKVNGRGRKGKYQKSVKNATELLAVMTLGQDVVNQHRNSTVSSGNNADPTPPLPVQEMAHHGNAQPIQVMVPQGNHQPGPVGQPQGNPQGNQGPVQAPQPNPIPPPGHGNPPPAPGGNGNPPPGQGNPAAQGPSFGCIGCGGGHWFSSCTIYPTISQREGVLHRLGKCIRCFNRNHGNSPCRRVAPCFYCSSAQRGAVAGTHNSALCPYHFPY